MDKAKSSKKAVVALLIFALIALVAWGVFFVIFILGQAGFVSLHFGQLIRMFNPAGLTPDMYLPLSISVLSIAGLLVIFFILMLVLSIVKRRGIMALPFVMLLLSGFAAAEFIANLSRFTALSDSIQSGYLHFMMDTSEDVTMSSRIMVFAIAICAALAFLLSLIAYVVSMVNTCKYPKSKNAQVDSALDETAVEAEESLESSEGFVEEPEPEQPVDEKKELVDMIRDLIREELRGAQQPQTNNSNNTTTVTGATFSAPLVVQYFNGLNPVAAPAPEAKPEPKPEPEPVKEVEPVEEEYVEPELVDDEPAPVVEEKKPEPEPEPEPVKEEPVAEPEPAPVAEEPAPEPVAEPVAEVAPVEEKAKIIRIPFEERMVAADQEMKDNYNEIKNEILSYGVKSRVSNSGDTFRLHRKTYVKLTIAGKSLKLYFALNPEDYKDSTIPVQDASEKNIYAEIPLVFKVKSGLSLRRCKQLIADVMAVDGLEQGEVEKVNWAKEIAASLKEGKKASEEDDD